MADRRHGALDRLRAVIQRVELSLELLASGQLRASVAVRAGHSFASVWTLGRELADEAHRLARVALEERGASPGMDPNMGAAHGGRAWSVCWTVGAAKNVSKGVAM